VRRPGRRPVWGVRPMSHRSVAGIVLVIILVVVILILIGA
jgi:hypothetical protein